MKLKRKLLAAGFAFGATALTLTTSTFAWYSANNEVTVNAISGSTSAATDTSLFVAAATSYASASETISASAPGAKVNTVTTWSTEATPVLVNSSASRTLTPVAYTSANTYQYFSTVKAVYSEPETQPTSETFASGEYFIQGGTQQAPTYTKATEWQDGKTYYVYNHDKADYQNDASSQCVYEYVLRFQKPNATTSTPVYVSAFNLSNTSNSASTSQLALANNAALGTGKNVGILQAGAYNVDMLHALKMTVAVTNLTSDGSYEATPTVASTTVYDLDGFADTTRDTNIGTTAAALNYYNTVLGTQLKNEQTTYLSGAKCIKLADAAGADSANSQLFVIPATGFVEVRFTFWLDGWDEFCYDTCQAQGFKVDMAFSTDKSKAILTQATAATGKAQTNQTNG